MRPPLLPICFIFMQFSGNFSQIIGWRPFGIPFWEIPDLPLLIDGNIKDKFIFVILISTFNSAFNLLRAHSKMETKADLMNSNSQGGCVNLLFDYVFFGLNFIKVKQIGLRLVHIPNSPFGSANVDCKKYFMQHKSYGWQDKD